MHPEEAMEEDEDNNLSQFDLKQKEILSEQTTKLLLEKTQSLSSSIHDLHESLRHGPLLEPLDRATILQKSDEKAKPKDESTNANSTAGARWTTFAKTDMGRSKREEEPRRTDRFTMLTSMGEESQILQRRNSLRKLRGYARYKKSLKHKVEAHLNKITERHVTRTVETFFHTQTSSTDLSYEALASVDIKASLLLEFSQANIEIPVCENLFYYVGKLILSKHQVHLVQAIFWFIYKCNFVPGVRALDKKTKDKRESAIRKIKSQERLLVKKFISSIYVSWLKSLTRIRIPSKRDLLHKYLSFATAYAVIAGYRYLCPGSRHLYTTDFRREVFEESSRLLMSYEFSPGSIKITCSQLFPEDLDIIRDCSATPVVDESKTLDSTGHSQDSTKYNAKGVGELLETYLEDNTTQEDSLWGSDQLSRSYTTSSLHLLRRRKYSPALDIAQGSTQTNYDVKFVAEEHSRRMREFRSLRKECREQLAREFKQVSDAENAIYNGDTANAGRVCLDLVQKHLTLRPTLKQKGNGRLDWHGILEVNKTIPIAERVVAVRDALDAVKAKEERNPRTRARLMLLKHGQS